MPVNSDFRELLKLFNAAKIKYLIVGGYAVIEYTEPRYTKDFDIWVNPNPANARKVFGALKEFGAPLVSISAKDFENKEMVYQMGLPPGRIDILMGPKGLAFEDCWERRRRSKYGDVTVNFLSLDDLIKNKETVGRPQDLIDVENLRHSKKIIREVPPRFRRNG